MFRKYRGTVSVNKMTKMTYFITYTATFHSCLGSDPRMYKYHLRA